MAHAVTPAFEDVYTGLSENHVWYLGNACVGGTPDASVCTVSLGEALPPLWIGPRDRTSSVPVLLKEVTLESEDFDRRFRVQALDREYASDIVSPRVMEMVMQRDDWTFFLAFSTPGLRLRGAVPGRRRHAGAPRPGAAPGRDGPVVRDDDRGAHLPTLPDGTVLDLTDPSSRAAVEAALAAMTPQEREDAVQQVQEQGLRFVAGMFGKDLPPDKLAELQRRLEERHHQDGQDGRQARRTCDVTRQVQLEHDLALVHLPGEPEPLPQVEVEGRARALPARA